MAFFKPMVLLAASWLALVTIWLVGLRRKQPGAAVGWLSFLLMILPFTGLFQAGNAMAADRYTYLAMVPLAIMAGAVLRRLLVAGRIGQRLMGLTPLSLPLLAIVLCAWSCLTVRQIPIWKNSAVFWEYTLREVPREFIPLSNYSSVLIGRGQCFLACVMAREALRCNPKSDIAWHQLGVAAALCGQTDEAIKALREAVHLNPAAGDSHFELAKLLHRKGVLEEARRHYFAAVQDEPANERLANLAVVLDNTGHPDPAMKFLAQAALKGDSTAYLLWATILIRHSELERAYALLALGYRSTGDPLLRKVQRKMDAKMPGSSPKGRD